MKMFKNAINGFLCALRTERNMSIHLVIASFVLVYLMVVRAEIYHFVLAYTAMFLVISSELMNTALERLCNFVEPEHNQEIKIVKDLSASAVLLNAIFAVLLGYVIWITM